MLDLIIKIYTNEDLPYNINYLCEFLGINLELNKEFEFFLLEYFPIQIFCFD